MKLSCVITVYKAKNVIPELHNILVETCFNLCSQEFEIIYVVDACPDNSAEVLRTMSCDVGYCRVINLARNVGQSKAIMTGLEYATGDLVWLMDGDLEEDPRWIGVFWDRLKNLDCDVVYGVQKMRKGDVFERISGAMFYSIINILSNQKIPRNLVTSRIMKKMYVDAILKHKERVFNFAGLALITGFNQQEIVVEKRFLNKSSYSIRKKAVDAISTILTTSTVPLLGVFVVSGAMFVFGAILAILNIIEWYLIKSPIYGWGSLIASIWFVGGCLGLGVSALAWYVHVIFIESKNRPRSIVAEDFVLRSGRSSGVRE